MSEEDPVQSVGPPTPDRQSARPARHYTAEAVTDPAGITWIGEDDRGIELEIVLVETSDVFLVIHVMPTSLRRRK